MTTSAGGFDGYAVWTPTGPHLTMQAGLVHRGRYWTTTTRNSVKVAAVNRSHRAGVVIGEAGGWRVIAGRTSVLDLVHPSGIVSDAVSALLSGPAVARLGLAQLDQLAGYARAGRAVPAGYLPTGRVVLVTHLQAELVLSGHDVVRSSGVWRRDPLPLRMGGERSQPWEPGAVLDGVPDAVGPLVCRTGPAFLALATRDGVASLPAVWDAATGTVSVGRTALGIVGPDLPGPVCITLDDSGSDRPDEKLGVMLRGRAMVVELGRGAARLAISVERVTHWLGFDTATVDEAA
jgi:hypothetical protein